MDRREIVRLMGATAMAAPLALSPDALAALGRDRTPGGWTSRRHPAFNDAQHDLIDQISELIMPATDTPGARAAGVAGFIEVIVGEYYKDDERAAFLRGLADVDTRSQSLFTKPFMQATEPQQTTVLTGLDAESRAMPPGSPQHFFARFKNLTLYGYYTSEIGYTQELQQTFMPGHYDGSAPLNRHAATPSGGR
jgi:hypothetical protein